MSYHNPVLLKESVDGLNINPSGIYVDVTYGGGGHSKEMLSRLNKDGRLFSFDQDLDAHQNKIDDPRFVLIHQNFRFIKNSLRFLGVKKVDGILADLGVSSHQFDEGSRGFSTRFNGELDMRMNTKSSLTAKEIVNKYDFNELVNLFKYYGELNGAKSLVRPLIKAREEKEIVTTEDLKNVFSFLPNQKKHKIFAQIFQAIRIEVNKELEALKELLTQGRSILNKDGQFSVISYHSLEDRLIKNFFKKGVFKGDPEKDIFGRFENELEEINRKVIIPNSEEIEKNNRARSAKLRVAKKK